MDQEEESTPELLSVAKQNARNFEKLGSDAKSVLYREDRFMCQSTALTDSDISKLDLRYDIDGVSIVLKQFAHINRNIGNIALDQTPSFAKTMVKKHDLNIANELRDRSMGLYLGRAGELQVVALIIPKAKSIDVPKCVKVFKSDIRKTLLESSVKNPHVNTFKTNDLLAPFLKITWNNEQYIYRILDIAAQKQQDVTITPFLYRFGQKSGQPFHPQEYVSTFDSMCVHTGVNIYHPEATLLWSRQGIQSVASRAKGNIFKTYSMRAAANLQTSYVTRLEQDLQNISATPHQMTFLQMYTDSPHLKVPYTNPISTLMSGCGTLHHRVST